MNNSIVSCIVTSLMQSESPQNTGICSISVLMQKDPEHSVGTVDHKAELKAALEDFEEALGVKLPLSAIISSVEKKAEFAHYEIKFSSATAATEFYNEIAVNAEPVHVFADEISFNGSSVTLRAAGEQGKALEAIMKAHSAMAKQVCSR